MTENNLNPQEELERLRRENEELKARASGQNRSLSMKVSEKGALSIYGMGKFPVTLYKEQWIKVLNMSEDIRKFIKDNDSALKSKER